MILSWPPAQAPRAESLVHPRENSTISHLRGSMARVAPISGRQGQGLLGPELRTCPLPVHRPSRPSNQGSPREGVQLPPGSSGQPPRSGYCKGHSPSLPCSWQSNAKCTRGSGWKQSPSHPARPTTAFGQEGPAEAAWCESQLVPFEQAAPFFHHWNSQHPSPGPLTPQNVSVTA